MKVINRGSISIDCENNIVISGWAVAGNASQLRRSALLWGALRMFSCYVRVLAVDLRQAAAGMLK